MTNAADETPLVVGRLAPSPTGPQHVGNARTYLLAWLSVRLQDGRLIFRMEDLDSSRVRQPAIVKVIQDLTWLGLDWDYGPDGRETADATTLLSPNSDAFQARNGRGLASWFQSERQAIYQYYFQDLIDQEAVYRCFCSRKDIQRAASAPNLGDEGLVYPGTCRERSSQDVRQRLANGDSYCWRFKITEQHREYNDLKLGRRDCEPAKQLGDFIICRKSGEFAYQLAVTVDDHLMGVTEVVRGDDLVPSAFRQLELYQAMGWRSPDFVHVPLVHGRDGRRLAKRHGSIRIDYFRQRDNTPERFVGLLAHSCGLIDINEPLTTGELLAHCRANHVNIWNLLPNKPWTIDAI